MARVAPRQSSPVQIKCLSKVGFSAVGTATVLGGYPTVSLKEVIDKARTTKSQINSGIDPIAQNLWNLSLMFAILNNKSF